MSEFRLLVAIALRDIAQQLSETRDIAQQLSESRDIAQQLSETRDIAPPDPARPPSEPPAPVQQTPAPNPVPPPPPPAHTRRAEPDEVLFVLHDDHRLPSGNYLVRTPPDPASWRVYTIAGERAADGPSRLLHRASIDAGSETPEFIARAYRCILGRPADSGGLDHYGRALGSARMNRMEVLAELTASNEAASQQRRLVVLPESVAP